MARLLRRYRTPAFAAALGMMAGLSCIRFDAADERATQPESPGDLAVIATAGASATFAGATADLSASASGGSPPYLFRWDQNAGPANVAIGSPDAADLTVGPLDEPGRYVFRVVVTDSSGRHASGFVSFEVLDPVETDIPPLAIVNEPTLLSASIDSTANGTAVLWTVTRGNAEVDTAAEPTATLTARSAESIGVRLTVEIAATDGPPAVIEEDFEIAAVPDPLPGVLVETSLGDFTIELDGQSAPRHTANFLLYVDDGFYNGLLIHRVVCSEPADGGPCEPFVVQGGGFRRDGDEVVAAEPTRDPVASESDNGRTNAEPYSVALALAGGDPDSGTTQFFINLDPENGFLDAQGFTVFGSVTSGTAVVDAIAAVETMASSIIPGEPSLPVDDIVIERISRLSR